MRDTENKNSPKCKTDNMDWQYGLWRQKTD